MQTTMDPVNLCARENIIGDFRVVVFFLMFQTAECAKAQFRNILKMMTFKMTRSVIIYYIDILIY